jgi:hypothetical protein
MPLVNSYALDGLTTSTLASKFGDKRGQYGGFAFISRRALNGVDEFHQLTTPFSLHGNGINGNIRIASSDRRGTAIATRQ